MAKHRNVTIVGGGFGGVKTALELARDKARQITLISDQSYFQYYPALFSTATGKSYRQSWVPLTEIFNNHPNVTLVNDLITQIDTEHKTVIGKSTYTYEVAIMALGSVTSYFGIEGLDTFSYGIKSQAEIKRLQDHLWHEMSDGTDDEKHYVIIGAGPTGVELAGALGDYVLQLRKHFGIRKKRVTINLIEAAPRVLPRLSVESSKRAERKLKSLGVHVELNRKVEKQTAESLMVNGKPLTTQTVIWTSGVANAPFYAANTSVFKLNERGKVIVDEYMMAAKDVYVIGDNANTPYAGLAQTALHDALFVSKHINGSTKSYKAVLPPCVIPIGDKWAVFEWKWLKFGGLPGAMLRSAADIIGYRDVLPLGYAFKAWRAQQVHELKIPNKLTEE